jgi:hypothetical protein
MLQRVVNNGIPCLIGFHAQEFRSEEQPLDNPLKCTSHEAWLGFGYYFWVDESNAHRWGKQSKRRTGQYDIYQAAIEEMGILNTSFSETAYFFWKETIDKVIASFKQQGLLVSLVEVQRYLVDKYWPTAKITGIIYDDLPQGGTHSEISPLFYKKRIQIVVFDLKKIVTFDLLREAQAC